MLRSPTAETLTHLCHIGATDGISVPSRRAIPRIIDISPIHLLSISVLFGSWAAIRDARAHRIAAHKRQVLGLYLGGGGVGAGAFTLLPGRIMNAVVFAYPQGVPKPGQLAAFLGLMAAVIAMLYRGARASTAKRA